MTQEITNILSYFFNLSPGNTFNYSFLFSLAAAICFLIAITVIVYRRTSKDKVVKRIFRPFPAQFISLAVTLLLYLFFRLNNVAVFSARIFLYLLVIWLFWMGFALLRTVFKDFPAARLEESAKSEGQTKYFLLKNKKAKGRGQH